jgi:hypothetical protein
LKNDQLVNLILGSDLLVSPGNVFFSLRQDDRQTVITRIPSNDKVALKNQARGEVQLWTFFLFVVEFGLKRLSRKNLRKRMDQGTMLWFC